MLTKSQKNDNSPKPTSKTLTKSQKNENSSKPTSKMLAKSHSQPSTTTLPNGDLYIGRLSSRQVPDGPGKYLWADGCSYSGPWRNGKANGTGKMSWPSGASYEGEFKEGKMDGIGFYISGDGGSYKGGWEKDMKSGFGEKRFRNGDWYEGGWRGNVMEGYGRYVWRNGNEYVGAWRNGGIYGRGLLVWANGNRYDGNWENGVPKGQGVFTWPDGSCYVGNWSSDLRNETKNSKQNHPQPILSGTFYPGTNKTITGGKHRKHQSLTFDNKTTLPLIVDDIFLAAMTKKRSSVDGSRKSLTGKIFPRICIWESDGKEGDITCDIIDNVKASMFYKDGMGLGSDYIRDFRKAPYCFNGELKKPGKTISKGHKNYDLMINLQLGIRYSVGKHAPIQRELKPKDFDPMEKFWTRFPSEGSKTTPPHQSTEFRWKDYCPMVFRRLRDLFQVDPADYMLAICGNDALRELSSPGKSGSFFYLTQDDRFMIKTVKKSECKVLIKMLSSYYQHVCRYKNTLVTKFFGVHCVKPVGGLKTRFIVMGNLFCSVDQIHRRFDLKGSSHGRTTDRCKGEIDETTTLKDLDLNFVFRLQSNWFQELIKQINRDCEFLEAERIMDYSLLVGIHFRDSNGDRISLPPFLFQTGKIDSLENEKFIRGCRFLQSQLQDVEKVLTIRKPSVRLGANMPATAERVLLRKDYNQCTPDGVCKLASSQGGELYEVVLHFGIIDILQDYDMSKKLEHAYKSLQVDPGLISAVDPKLYSKRFRDFISRVFVEDS